MLYVYNIHLLTPRHRASFVHLAVLLLLTICLACSPATGQNNRPDCEWCGSMDAPSNPGWSTVIAQQNEPGTRIRIHGTVYQSDGITPASGVLLYVYHTNNEGIYAKKGNETGNGVRHGYLRGWMKTSDTGQYEFRSIRPAAYPGRTEPEHIHITITPPEKEEYWINSYLFLDDPLLTDEKRNKRKNDHFSNILELQSENGVLVGRRDIILK